MSTRTPTEGGRVLLELQEVAPPAVSYSVTLATPTGSCSGLGVIDVPTGAIELRDWTETPPDWLEGSATAFLKTVWSARRKEESPRWPRRVHRWRAPKE